MGFIGRKLIRDERQRQLTYRRQQAKMSCRRYLDEANFVIEKDCLDSLRRTRRELRDEFQARAGVLHASSQRALTSAERAAPLGPAGARPAGRGAGRLAAPRSSGSAGRRPRRPEGGGVTITAPFPPDDPLTAAVRELVSAARDRALDPAPRDQLADAVDRLSGPLRLAIAGRVKAGKSTLLNALVGEELAPTDAGECTKLVTWYIGGHAAQVTARAQGRAARAAPVQPRGRRAGGRPGRRPPRRSTTSR